MDEETYREKMDPGKQTKRLGHEEISERIQKTRRQERNYERNRENGGEESMEIE